MDTGATNIEGDLERTKAYRLGVTFDATFSYVEPGNCFVKVKR
jgi:hypothetical protein